MARLDKHFVTTKAAIYSDDNQSVLVMKYAFRRKYQGFGLPGGHVDAGETPDQAIARELDEELGIRIENLERRDFFLHSGGHVVLAFVGHASSDFVMTPSDPQVEFGVWKTRQELDTIEISDAYRAFIVANWPAL
ncbi:MAG TPA: NUDIX hydrolase [Candidatus Saccharimonadales bacterium]|nr:NUDIX hydrolase [Candidatus Saccharimonadales bacterium]